MIEINKRVLGPDFLLQLLPGHYLPRIFQQRLQNKEGLFLQMDFGAAFAQLSGTKVELE